MIRIEGSTLTWDEHDAEAMARLIGADPASKLRAPYSASILKLAAKQKHTKLSRVAQAVLAQDEDKAARALELQRLKDAPGDPALFRHQRADLLIMEKLGRPGYILGHDVGGGKTAMAIRQAERWYGKRNLIITMNSAKDQWADEISRWAGFFNAPIINIAGTTDEQIRLASMKFTGWYIGHWESLVTARLGYLQYPWDVVIADEAHLAQNRDTQRAQTLLALEAKHKLALTAHPYSTAPHELFAILQFLYPDIYTSYWRFFNMHVRAIPKPFGGHSIDGPRRPKLLKWELAPIMLRRTKAEMFPHGTPVQHVKRTATLTQRGQREYDRLKKAFFAQLDALDGGEKHIVIPGELARLTRWRQYLIAPALLGGREPSVKFPIVRELMDATDAPPVIFTSFAEAIPLLQKFLKGLRVPSIEGKTPLALRNKRKHAFVAGKYDGIIVQSQTGEAALNLGGFGHVIHLDLPWRKRSYEQAVGRVDRPKEGTGELVPTTAYRIVVKGSYEERIEKKLITQHSHFKEVFTVADLKELFA